MSRNHNVSSDQHRQEPLPLLKSAAYSCISKIKNPVRYNNLQKIRKNLQELP